MLPHRSTEFLVGHTAVIFLLAPKLSHSFRFKEAENPLGAILPFDQAGVALGVQENVPDELPQVRSTRICGNMWLCERC